jgi:hypothetical protein
LVALSYEEAIRRAEELGQRNVARVAEVRLALLTSPPAVATPSGRRLLWVERQNPLAGEPTVAFLASLKPDAPLAVYRLKPGLNRVGHDPMFGDFTKAPGPFIESRQWIITCLERGRVAFVADDHSTNQSAVLSRSAPALTDLADPRTANGPFTTLHATLEVEGSVRLDWKGNRVAELEDGDVLCPVYGPLVFGWASPSPP